jgi:hypothetical protein
MDVRGQRTAHPSIALLGSADAQLTTDGIRIQDFVCWESQDKISLWTSDKKIVQPRISIARSGSENYILICPGYETTGQAGWQAGRVL